MKPQSLDSWRVEQTFFRSTVFKAHAQTM